MKNLLLVAGVTLFGIAGGVASAAPVQLTADGDAVVQGGASSTTAFGTRSFLLVRDQAGAANDFDRASLLRFDLSGISGPITSAELELTVNFVVSASRWSPDVQSFNLFGLDDSIGDSWDEATVTWDTAPGDVGDNSVTGGTLLDTFDQDGPPVSGSKTVFTGAPLVDFLNTGVGQDGLVTFVIEDASALTRGLTWASREHASLAAPTLRLNTASVAAISLPASGALLIGGVALVAGLRRSQRRGSSVG